MKQKNNNFNLIKEILSFSKVKKELPKESHQFDQSH
jgi:hypothetical protein